MKYSLVFIFMTFTTIVFGSEVEWGKFVLVDLGYPTIGYAGTSAYTDTSLSLITTQDKGKLTIKESGNTSLISFATWSLAFEGETIDNAFFNDQSRLFYNGDGHGTHNPIVVATDNDSFFLAFKTLIWEDEMFIEPKGTDFGWIELCTENGELKILDSAINLSGTAIFAGGGSAVPEPTSGLLLLFGIASLALRRRK